MFSNDATILQNIRDRNFKQILERFPPQIFIPIRNNCAVSNKYINYRYKYIKYKNKYIKLKLQIK